MRMVMVVLVVVLVLLQYKLWFSATGVPQWLYLQQQLKTQQATNQKISAQNDAVEANIVGLKSGEEALEEQARFELGMVKDDEEYYQLIDRP